MGISTRNSNQSRSKSFCPYLAILAFAAILVFKVDVLISQTIYAARRNIETTHRPRHLVVRPAHDAVYSSSGNGTFNRYFILTWGEPNAKIINDGEVLNLGLDKKTGSGFQSRKEYLYCKISMRIKLVPGNSAGTVTTYYLSSEGSHHDEIDFEFLGNSSGQPYTLHTNVFSQGKGEREMQFFLWFDPTADYHTYSIVWNPKNILFYVDGTPIREFKNAESLGVTYLKDQAMRLYSSLWCGDEWATQGGRVKTNWKLAPFIASYKNFNVEACIWSKITMSNSCDDPASNTTSMEWYHDELSNSQRLQMKRLQNKYRVYNYCVDKNRFPKGPAPECKLL